MQHYHRRRFGGASLIAVKVILKVRKGKRGRCDACGLHVEVGDAYTVLKLDKRFAPPCASCSLVPKLSKRFHTACVPPDVNAAMGYDPDKTAPAYVPPPCRPSGAVPPPPKPLSAFELTLTALLAVETALKRRIAENPALINNADLEATLKTYNGCKARALRPGTDPEGHVALKMSLKRAIDLVF